MNKSSIEENVAKLKEKIHASNKQYILNDEDENGDEYAHFYFIGNHKGNEVVFDTVIYTLRLQHESELFEIAEQRAAKHFPQYKKINYQEEADPNLESSDLSDPMEEEIGLFMAEVIMELEEEEAIKVKEHVDIDEHNEFEIGLDVGLHVESVTPKVIEDFIKNFKTGTLNLDETYYAFQTEDESD